MSGTKVSQVRKPVKVEGTNKYSVSATCIEAGSLPDTNIFLMSIIQALDPKNDELVRIAQVSDFTEYGAIRDTAIDSGESRYRSSDVILYYEDLETANEAWKVLSSRINDLVEQIDKYSAEFETPPTGEVTTYPAVDQSTINQLKEDYKATLDPLEEAKKERDAAQQSCTQLEDDIAVIEERLKEARGDLETVQSLQTSLAASNSSLSSIEPTISTYKDQIRTTNNSSSASTSDQDSIEGGLRNIEAELAALSSVTSDLSTLASSSVATLVSTLQSRVASLISDKNEKLVQLNQCNAKVVKLEGTVDAARKNRDSALASVRSVCPDFTP